MSKFYLGNPTNTLAVINRYEFAFQKKFGQNFLIDQGIVEKIVREAGVTKDDFVLEIGPGIGTMTQILCENAREVAAVEIDRKLIPILNDTLSEYDNVTIINDDIHKVWDIVFAVDKYSAWRSDLSKTEIINDKQFIEYTKDGYATTFSITAVEPYKRWEFDMKNSNMTGYWIGIFTAKGNETQIDFTENVTPKKWIMKPFVKIYLKKQQEQFVLDLKKALK